MSSLGGHKTEAGLPKDYHYLYKGSSWFERFPKGPGCVGGSRKLSWCQHQDSRDNSKTNHWRNERTYEEVIGLLSMRFCVLMHSRKCTIDTLFFDNWIFLVLVEVVHSVMIMFLCHNHILCLLVVKPWSKSWSRSKPQWVPKLNKKSSHK